MPRRKVSDPLASEVGARVRQLRRALGLTLERLAYESELGSKGHLSDLEKGLVVPTIGTLKVLADHLGVELFDLVTFPTQSVRHDLVDQTRAMSGGAIRKLLRELKTGSRDRG